MQSVSGHWRFIQYNKLLPRTGVQCTFVLVINNSPICGTTYRCFTANKLRTTTRPWGKSISPCNEGASALRATKRFSVKQWSDLCKKNLLLWTTSPTSQVIHHKCRLSGLQVEVVQGKIRLSGQQDNPFVHHWKASYLLYSTPSDFYSHNVKTVYSIHVHLAILKATKG